MAYNTPSTQELVDRCLAGIESALGVTSPIADKAFNRAWATVLGMAASGLYAYAADRVRANLAITASEEDLEVKGEEYNVPRRMATSWRGKIRLALDAGVTLYLGTVFTSANGRNYETTQTAVGGAGGTVIISAACKEAGPGGNLSAGDTLTIQSPAEGAGRTAVVTAVDKMGLDKEGVEDYRLRVLDAIRGGSGGTGGAVDDATGVTEIDVPACVTSSDYRLAAEAVGGVARAYPFSGPPEGSGLSPVPGQRTVYIECTPDIDPDGIPPQALLDIVRAALVTDPATGLSREVLGVPSGEDLLFVEPVIRTGLYVTVVNMRVIGSSRAAAEAAVTEAVRDILARYAPFAQGLDAEFDRRDEITNANLSREIQNALDVFGGTAENVYFNDSPTGGLGSLTLAPNQKVKLLQITFQGNA
jgi:uncharacterized phage protein gp47/JayE